MQEHPRRRSVVDDDRGRRSREARGARRAARPCPRADLRKRRRQIDRRALRATTRPTIRAAARAHRASAGNSVVPLTRGRRAAARIPHGPAADRHCPSRSRARDPSSLATWSLSEPPSASAVTSVARASCSVNTSVPFVGSQRGNPRQSNAVRRETVLTIDLDASHVAQRQVELERQRPSPSAVASWVTCPTHPATGVCATNARNSLVGPLGDAVDLEARAAHRADRRSRRASRRCARPARAPPTRRSTGAGLRCAHHPRSR